MGHYASEMADPGNSQRSATYELYEFLGTEIERMEMLGKAKKFNASLPIEFRLWEFLPGYDRELAQMKELRKLVGQRYFNTDWDLKKNGGWK